MRDRKEVDLNVRGSREGSEYRERILKSGDMGEKYIFNERWKGNIAFLKILILMEKYKPFASEWLNDKKKWTLQVYKTWSGLFTIFHLKYYKTL